MKNNKLSRRDFMKKCLAGSSVVAGLSCKSPFTGKKDTTYDSKGLPTRVLGKTGVRVPLIVVGCGSRFCAVQKQDKSVKILNAALDHGLYYWDTAHDYVYSNVVSEERLGLVLKNRRDEVFLATKVGERTYDGAMRHIEESLNRLQTDRLDILQIHLIRSLDDVEKICAEDGVLKALRKLKDEKVTRFLGFSGHLSAEAMMEMANRYDFDTMLIALNHYSERQGDFEKQAIPTAAEKKMGILAMKVIRPRETVEGLAAEDLIRYALSLKHVHAAVIGTDSLEVLEKNIQLVNNFKKISPDEMKKISIGLEPVFAGNNLPWMKPSYTDGVQA
jgi:aryl-alcohol dehydrogenase-like predicted oxidoreductase